MRRLILFLCVVAISSVGVLGQNARSTEHWVGAWSTALVVAPPVVAPAAPAGGGQAPASGAPR